MTNSFNAHQGTSNVINLRPAKVLRVDELIAAAEIQASDDAGCEFFDITIEPNSDGRFDIRDSVSKSAEVIATLTDANTFIRDLIVGHVDYFGEQMAHTSSDIDQETSKKILASYEATLAKELFERIQEEWNLAN